MVVGKVKEWMGKLDKGEAVILTRADLIDSARHYMESAYDSVRTKYILNVIDEVNSDEYPDFDIRERLDGRFTLERQ
jgi:hypothetical protein